MKKTFSQNIALWIAFIIFVLYAISLIFPMVTMVYNSFKLTQEFFQKPWALPSVCTWENYAEIFEVKFQRTNIFGMFFNSMVYVFGGVTTGLVLSCMTSYIMAKYKFKGSNVFYSFIVACMLVPTVGSTPALYRFLYQTNLLNTYAMIFILQGGFGSTFLFMYGYFRAVSWSYAESAFIDGAGHVRTFFQIILPHVMGGLIAMAIICYISTWNDYFTQYLYFRAKPTVAVGLQLMVSKFQIRSEWPKIFAASIIATIPPLLVFAVFNRQILKDTVAGGLKG